jgi:NAD(P)H-quinone oxidoreductase subunit 4
MNGRELTIGFSLLLPTLVIGFWPKIAINLYESSTNALSQQLTLAKLVGFISNISQF